MDPFKKRDQYNNVVKIYNATKYTFVVVNAECPRLEYRPDFSPLKCSVTWNKDILASSTVCLPIMNNNFSFSSSELWFEILERNQEKERDEKTALIVDYDILRCVRNKYWTSLLCPVVNDKDLFSASCQGESVENVVISGFARVSN